jgi:xanthine dehydrogenase large subunit
VRGLAFTGPALSWEDVVKHAYFARVQLWAAGFYRTEGLHWDSTVMRGAPFKYFSYGVAASEVEVDGFTGAHRLRRVDIVHDVGDSLSPLIDLGQIEAGSCRARLAHPRGPALGRERRAQSRSPVDPGRQHVQAAEPVRDAGGLPRHPDDRCHRGRRRLRVQGRRRAAAHAGLLRAGGLRQAAAAFGPPGRAWTWRAPPLRRPSSGPWRTRAAARSRGTSPSAPLATSRTSRVRRRPGIEPYSEQVQNELSRT